VPVTLHRCRAGCGVRMHRTIKRVGGKGACGPIGQNDNIWQAWCVFPNAQTGNFRICAVFNFPSLMKSGRSCRAGVRPFLRISSKVSRFWQVLSDFLQKSIFQLICAQNARESATKTCKFLRYLFCFIYFIFAVIAVFLYQFKGKMTVLYRIINRWIDELVNKWIIFIFIFLLKRFGSVQFYCNEYEYDEWMNEWMALSLSLTLLIVISLNWVLLFTYCNNNNHHLISLRNTSSFMLRIFHSFLRIFLCLLSCFFFRPHFIVFVHTDSFTQIEKYLNNNNIPPIIPQLRIF